MAAPAIAIAPDRDWQSRVLTDSTRRIATALTEAILSDTDAAGRLSPAPTELTRPVVDGIDRMVGSVSPQARRAWTLGLWLIELLPVLLLLRLRRMSGLPLAVRLLYLERLETSRIGLLAALLGSLKATICIHAFEQRELLVSTGFDRSSLSGRRTLRVVSTSASSRGAA